MCLLHDWASQFPNINSIQQDEVFSSINNKSFQFSIVVFADSIK